MQIGSLSKSLGVPVPTLRRWTQEFAVGLSAEGRGGEGRPRRFTARDHHLLARARDLLTADEATYASVRRQLVREGLMAASGNIDGPATAAEREAGERFVLAVAERGLAPLREKLAVLEAQLALLAEQLEELQAHVAAVDRGPSVRRLGTDDRRQTFR